MRMAAVLVLALGCAATQPSPPVDVPACIASEAKEVQRSGSFDPVGAVAQEVSSADVVAVGEFHRIVAEIEFFAQVIGRSRGPFDVGLELLPASRQNDLDALVTAETFESWTWWSIVGDRHDLKPLDFAEYEAIPRAVWEANRARPDDPIRLVGLLPDCRVASHPSREAVIDCFRDRDASMAAIAEEEVLGKGRRLLLGAGTFHVARRMEDPDSEPWPTVTGVLAKTRSVRTVLLAGPIEGDGATWGALCGGLFESLHGSMGRAFVVPTARLDLSLSCLGPAAGGHVPLADAFDLVVELGPSTAEPSALDSVAFSAIGPAALRTWDQTRTDLYGEAPWETAEAWRLESGRELMRFTDIRSRAVSECPER